MRHVSIFGWQEQRGRWQLVSHTFKTPGDCQPMEPWVDGSCECRDWKTWK
jgi:hypothetical protein